MLPAQWIAAGVRPAGAAHTAAQSSRWGLEELAGRLVELSARGPSGLLTLAARLVLEAQARREPCAWLNATTHTFHPPDLAANGIDLAALAVIRVRDAEAAGQAAGHLLRSGAFGLLVLDLAGPADAGRREVPAELSMPLQSRLVRLAQQHRTAVVALTDKSADSPSLGSLVSLRGEASRHRLPDGRFACHVRVLKDKRRGPGFEHTEICHGPPGLR